MTAYDVIQDIDDDIDDEIVMVSLMWSQFRCINTPTISTQKLYYNVAALLLMMTVFFTACTV